MKLVTWNVNSIRQRLPRLLALLERHEPDVVCLQETKVEDAVFPTMEIAAAGYECATFGQRAYNGVAHPVACGARRRAAPASTATRCPSSPVCCAARAGDLDVVCVYVVNGKAVGDPAYDTKLAWLDALRAWVAATFDPASPLVITGDFNIAPDDRDVWDAGAVARQDPRQRAGARAVAGRCLTGGSPTSVEPPRATWPGPFSYWDYTAGAFHKGWGLRIDLALGTAPVAARLIDVVVDREERKPSTGEGKPSDHAPVIVTLR